MRVRVRVGVMVVDDASVVVGCDRRRSGLSGAPLNMEHGMTTAV